MGLKRNTALDFNRGMMLIAMVLLHCVDELYPFSFLGRSLRYVSGSFIMVAGFVISNIYLNKYNITERQIYQRLFIRGLKLLILFSVLNISMILILKQSYDGRELTLYVFIRNFFQIYFLGIKELISFDMLLPISYLLMASWLLLLISKLKFRLTVIASAISVFIYCSVVYFDGSISYNLKFLSIGLFGLALGFIPVNRLDYYLNKYKALVMVSYILHLVVVKISMKYYLYYPVYVINVFINLVIFYFIGLKLKAENIFVKSVIMLGQYSLLTYIAHIGIIVVLRMIIYNILKVSQSAVSLSIVFIITAMVVVLLIKAVDLFRRRNSAFDRYYRLIFA